jgi:hypothetical protein
MAQLASHPLTVFVVSIVVMSFAAWLGASVGAIDSTVVEASPNLRIAMSSR